MLKVLNMLKSIFDKTFTPFQANVSIFYPLNTSCFLMFFRGVKWEHWPEKD